MSDQRFIIEMGMGNDQYGRDYQKAARRAIEDAIRHSSIPMFDALDLDHAEMRVVVTVGVQKPEAVDCAALAAGLPRGRISVTTVEGGLDVINPDSGNVIVIATAAVEAFLPFRG
ncbi:Lin0512 family protein [Defluviimonas sp. WL0024]|uniref:Lin0512 family protein n=2 Tax=Albidovulum TaxID=205889 RepID=A0ABT3J2T4_9RHOB|nr:MULTISPECIES: Lin0512 family protein [Defluviimonas]MCU9849418.1 Lin0512 family protein [Defluviimonas sp. WL0024]MCW3781984.1 Lin0512 family protein [Defluviimonas salinarum]